MLIYKCAPSLCQQLQRHFLSTQNQPQKLLDCVREVLRLKPYSHRTGQTYVDWINWIILFHKKHPDEMGASGMA